MKTIPLSIETCDEPSGEIPKLNIPLTRRSFLKGSAVLIGTIATSNILFALAPSPVWAVELKKLSKNQGTALMQMGRVLYPHDKLPDAVYALLAKDLDAEAANNRKLADQLVRGLKKLDQQAGGSFIAASDTKKLEAVTAMQGTPSLTPYAANASPRFMTTTWPSQPLVIRVVLGKKADTSPVASKT